MSKFVTIHEPGETIWTVNNSGQLLAYKVQLNGQVDELDLARAFAEEDEEG